LRHWPPFGRRLDGDAAALTFLRNLAVMMA
jgi:hypothetical protein